jgi:hydrogenase small subunit
MKVMWINAVSCNGNAHALLNAPQFEKFLSDFDLLHHPVIETKYSLNDVINKEIQTDILIIEGALSNDFERIDTSVMQIVKKYLQTAKHVITLGTCASYGGIFKENSQDVRGLHFKGEVKSQEFSDYADKTLSLAGCPVMPEIFFNVIYQIKYGYEIKVDKFMRPKEFFAYSVHNGCSKNEYFEYKVDSHNLGTVEGCMFYDYGCQGPFTAGACNKILWNGVNSKTRAGSPCFGCNEPAFPRQNLFETKKSMGVPKLLPLGVPKRAYLSIAGVSKSFKIERLHKGFFDD